MIVKSMARVANVMDVSRNADTSSTYSGMNPSFRRGDVDGQRNVTMIRIEGGASGYSIAF